MEATPLFKKGNKMGNKVTRVKGGVRIEFYGGTVVTLTPKAAEDLGYALCRIAVQEYKPE